MDEDGRPDRSGDEISGRAGESEQRSEGEVVRIREEPERRRPEQPRVERMRGDERDQRNRRPRAERSARQPVDATRQHHHAEDQLLGARGMREQRDRRQDRRRARQAERRDPTIAVRARSVARISGSASLLGWRTKTSSRTRTDISGRLRSNARMRSEEVPLIPYAYRH